MHVPDLTQFAAAGPRQPPPGAISAGGKGPTQWPTLHLRYPPRVQQPPEPSLGTPRRGRCLAVWIFCLTALLASAAVSFWWQWYKDGPAYSLAMAIRAARHDDAQEFDSFVDSDQIVEGFVRRKAGGLAGLAPSGLLNSLGAVGEGLAPGLLSSGRQAVRDELRRQVKELSAGAEGKPTLAVALAISYGVSFRRGGDSVTVTFDVDGRPVELGMRRTGEGGWKVVSVKDDVMAARVLGRLL